METCDSVNPNTRHISTCCIGSAISRIQQSETDNSNIVYNAYHRRCRKDVHTPFLRGRLLETQVSLAILTPFKRHVVHLTLRVP